MAKVKSLDIRKVEAEPCTCVRCGDCNGSGKDWLDPHGHYLRKLCDACGGSGISKVCDRCQLLDEMGYEDCL